MKIYKIIKPIVPGIFDNETIWFGKENYRNVKNVGIIFDEPPRLDLYTNHPVYFVSERFKALYKNSNLTGINKFELIRSSCFINEKPPKPLDIKYFTIQTDLKSGNERDFLRDRTKLLVSKKAMEFLTSLNIEGVQFESYDPDWHAKLLEKDRRDTAKNVEKQSGWIKRLFG